MQWDGGIIDHETTTPVSRTEPALRDDDAESHFGTEHLERADELEVVYDAIRSSARATAADRSTASGSRVKVPAPINFTKEMKARFKAHMAVQMLDATGLKHAAAEQLATSRPELAAEFRDVVQALASLSSQKGTVNIDKGPAPDWSTVDVFHMLRYLPERYFANPDGDHRAEIRQLLLVQGNLPPRGVKLIDRFADLYHQVMKATRKMSDGFYDDDAAMERSITSRARFENAPADLLERSALAGRLNEAVTGFRWTSAVVPVDHPSFGAPVREAVDKVVAASIRSVESLLTQGSSRPLSDGGIETEMRTVDGIHYSVRAWEGGRRKLHVSIPVDGDDTSGYVFPTLRVNHEGGAPHLHRDQIDAMEYRFTVDGWITPQSVNARLVTDEGRLAVTFDIPALASDVGRLEGVFHSTARGDFWWRDGQSDFGGYTFAVPDRQELDALAPAAHPFPRRPGDRR
jgi:hypothetical protein